MNSTGTPQQAQAETGPYVQQMQMLQQEEQMFEGPPPPPEPPLPKTIVIECNKSLSQEDGSFDKPHQWTNKFPAIKLKKGDIVSVNSAFLSSRGAGDLLQFDDTNSKTRLIFEYYNTNDNTSGKRPGYNMYGDGQSNPYNVSRDAQGVVTGRTNCFPADYRPMRLYRLMETYDISQDTPNTGVPAGVGTPIPDKIDANSIAPYPEIQGIETNWGYQRAGQQIVTGKEDDYVPGLIRHPTLNIREHMFSTGTPVPGATTPPQPAGTPNYWGDNLNAHIWYISTPKSKLFPCNPDASMRIHFQYGTGDKLEDALGSQALVRKLRPGMIIKFIDPEYLFGMRAQSYVGKGGTPNVAGSNCWVCDSYASDSHGVMINGQKVDSFRQVGDLRGSDFSNIAVGLGIDFMKITKVYNGANSFNMTGPNECNWIEVISDRAFSCAFGNPNLRGLEHGQGMPDSGGVALDARYWRNMQSSPNCSLFRTWMGEVKKVCSLTETGTNPWLPHSSTSIETNVPVTNCSFTSGDKFITMNNFRPNLDQSAYIIGCSVIPTSTNTEFIPRYNFIISLEDSGTNDTKVNLSHAVTRNAGVNPPFSSETITILTKDLNTMRGWNPGLFPELPTGAPEDMYLAYKAYWYNNSTNPNFQNSGVFASHTLETATQRATGPVADPLDSASEWLSRTNQFNDDTTQPTFTPPNFNLLAIGADGTSSNTELTEANFNTNKFLPEDYISKDILFDDYINPSLTYSGGRLPRCINPGDVGNKDLYETGQNYIKATREETLSHGPYINYWASFDNFSQYSTTPLDANPYIQADGVIDSYVLTGQAGLNRLPLTQQQTNQGGTVALMGDHGVEIKFYFCKNIRADESEFLGGTLPTQANAQRGAVGDWGDIHAINQDQVFPDGLNFIGAHAHAPGARYNRDGTPSNGGADAQRGLYYGFDIVSASNPNLNSVTQCVYSKVNLQDAVEDKRFLMSQVEQSFYAEFHNDAGETEVMLVWVKGNGFIDYDNNGTHERRIFATERINPGSGIYTPYTPEQLLMRDMAPGMVILKRDVLGTGKKAFLGNGMAHSVTSNCTIDPTAPLPQPGCFFTIIDVLANTESRITFNSDKYDVMSLTNQDFTATHAFKHIFTGPIDDIRSDGNKHIGGGDFILCKDPQQPYKDTGTGLPNYDNFQLTLFKENCLLDQGGDTTDIRGKTMGHTGKFSWGIHYDFVDLDVGADDADVFFSPSDVANKITQQLRAPKDLYNIQGGGNRLATGTFKNTADKYPSNACFRPICGPCATGMTEGPGALTGNYPEHSFCFFKDMDLRYINNCIFLGNMTNNNIPALLNPFADSGAGINSEGFPGMGNYGSSKVTGGLYPVFPRTVFTNRNLCPTTNSMTLTGHGNTNTFGGGMGFLYTRNLDRTYNSRTGISNPFDIEGTAVSQFVGTSNAQLIFNADHSRMEWQYLHQPVYSNYNPTTQSGAEEVVKIWAQGCDRLENWTRHGGINIVNWCADTTVTFNQYRSVRDTNYISPIDKAYPNANSKAFMNKIGFSDNWIQANSGSDFYPEDIANNDLIPGYRPLGTTDAEYDIVQSVNYLSEEPQKSYVDEVDRSRHFTPGNYPGTFDTSTDAGKKAIDDADKADFEYMTDQYLGAGMWAYANVYGGTISQWGPDGQTDPKADPTHSPPVEPTIANMEAYNNSRTMGELIGYSMPNTINTPKSVVCKLLDITTSSDGRSTRPTNDKEIIPGTNATKIYTDFNLDDVKYSYYQYAVISGGIRADSIPSKTKIGYYLIMSDLIDKHEFIGSANGGNPLNCIGVLSKNYESNDFYFSFQSPVEFYIKADKTITSIETRILQPDLTTPIGLDTNSSIIYTIIRPNNIPEPDVPPVEIQQAMDYALQDQLEAQMGMSGAFGGYMGISNLNLQGNSSGAGAGLNSLRQSLVQNVMQGGPQMMASLYGTESDIQMNLNRATVGQRQAMITASLGALDPADAHVIGQAPEQQQLENQSKAEQAIRAPIPPYMERMIDPSKPFFDGDFGIGDNEVPPIYRSQSRESRSLTPSLSERQAKASRDHIARISANRSTTPASAERAEASGGGPAEEGPRSPINMIRFEAEDHGGMRVGSDEDYGEPPPSPGPRDAEFSKSPARRKQFAIRQDPKTFIELWSGNFDTSTQAGLRARNMMHTAIAGGTEWHKPDQVPVDILREMTRLGESGITDMRGNRHRLDEADLANYRMELAKRTASGKRALKPGGKGDQPVLQEFTKPPPTGPKSDGGLFLYDVLHSKDHWLGRARTLDQKDNHQGFSGKENPYDIRTWSTGKVRNWASARETMVMKDQADRTKYKKLKESGADMSKYRGHVLKEGDAGLFQAELDRRAKAGQTRMAKKYQTKVVGEGTGVLEIHYNDKNFQPPNYQPHKPHQHSRGITRGGGGSAQVGMKVPGGNGAPPN